MKLSSDLFDLTNEEAANTMKEPIGIILADIQSLLKGLNDSEYTESQTVLSGSSIGQHVRHILEFYACLFESLESGLVCYDNRKRDSRIETDRTFTEGLIDRLLVKIERIDQDRPLSMTASFSYVASHEQLLVTSLYRELAYNLDHTIHHQALIKIGVNQINREELLSQTFGVAPSTVRHQHDVIFY